MEYVYDNQQIEILERIVDAQMKVTNYEVVKF